MRNFLVILLMVLFGLTINAQTKSRTTVVRKKTNTQTVRRTTPQKKPVNPISSVSQKETGLLKSFTVDLAGVLIDNEPMQCPPNYKCTYKLYDFGEAGKTAILDIPSIIVDNVTIPRQVKSWSGNISVIPAVNVDKSMEDGYLFKRGNLEIGGLMKTRGVWMAIFLSNPKCRLVSDIFPGMTVEEIKSKTQRELSNSQLKQTGTENGNPVYTLYWYDMYKQYHIDGDYHYNVSNDKAYARFYFDQTNKLVKWIFFY